jgi:hypothetical protein
MLKRPFVGSMRYIVVLMAAFQAGCIDSLSSTTKISFGSRADANVIEVETMYLVVKNDKDSSQNAALLKLGIEGAIEVYSKEATGAGATVEASSVQRSGRTLQAHTTTKWQDILQYLASTTTSWILKRTASDHEWELLSHRSFHTHTPDDDLDALAYKDAQITTTISIEAPGEVVRCNGEKIGANTCLWQDARGRDLSIVFINDQYSLEPILNAQIARLLAQLKSDSDSTSEKQEMAEKRKEAAYGIKLLGDSRPELVAALTKAFQIETDEDAKFAMSQTLRSLD